MWYTHHMTAHVLDTITTINQNTQRPTVWNIVHSSEASEATQQRYGWTHQFGVVRPNGRRLHHMWVVMIGDVVVRSTTPVPA